MKGELTSGVSNASERTTMAAAALAKPAVSVPETKPAPEPEKKAESSKVDDQKEPETPLESGETELPDEYESPFFKNVERNKKKEDESAKEVSKKPEQTTDGKNVRKIKADGLWHEVDLSDEKRVNELLSMGLVGKKVFSERDTYKKQVKTLTSEMKELQEFKKAIDYLEEVKDNDEELFRRVSGGRNLSDALRKLQEKEHFFATATPGELEAFKLKERMAALEVENKKTKQEREDTKKEFEAKIYATEKASTKQRFATEMRKVSFRDTVKDPIEAQALDEKIARDAIAGIKSWIGGLPKNTTVSEEMFDAAVVKEFSNARKFYDKYVSKQVDEKVAEIESKRSDEATKNAQLAAGKNYGKQLDKETLRKYAGRPTKLFADFFKK